MYLCDNCINLRTQNNSNVRKKRIGCDLCGIVQDCSKLNKHTLQLIDHCNPNIQLNRDDYTFKKFVDDALNDALANSATLTKNTYKSKYFLSTLADNIFMSISSNNGYKLNVIKTDKIGKGTKGEWLLDIAITKTLEVSQIYDGKVTPIKINSALLWAIESESHTGLKQMAEDLGKLLCVNSEKYVYMNGFDQDDMTSVNKYIESRLDVAIIILNNSSFRHDLYYVFFPNPSQKKQNSTYWNDTSIASGLIKALSYKLIYDTNTYKYKII